MRRLPLLVWFCLSTARHGESLNAAADCEAAIQLYKDEWPVVALEATLSSADLATFNALQAATNDSAEAAQFIYDERNAVDLGNPDACRYVTGHHPCLFGEPNEAIAYVLCVPLECTEDSYEAQGLPVRCGFHTYESDGGTAFVIVLYVLLGLLAVIGAVLGSFPRLMETCAPDVRRRTDSEHGAFTQLASGVGEEFKFREMSMDELLPRQDSLQQRKPLRRWERRFLCFDMLANTRRLLSPAKSGTSLAPINGIRVLSALWVLLFHTYLAVLNGAGENNYADVHPVNENREHSWIARWSFAVVSQGSLAAETFFMLAGFLAVKKLYPDYARSQENHISFKPLNICFVLVDTMKHVVTRAVRLTPALFVVALSSAYLVPTIGSGLWWDSGNRQNCRNYWHLDVLYVGNIDWRNEPGVDMEYSREDQCLPHTWFLSALMQYALLTPTVVWLYVLISRWTFKMISPRLRLHYGHQMSYVAGVSPIVSIVCVSVFRSYANSYLNDWSPFFFTEKSDFYWDYYLGPVSRAPSYCVGILFALFWQEWIADRVIEPLGGEPQMTGTRRHGVTRFQRHLSRSTLCGLLALATFLVASTFFAVVEPSQQESTEPPFAYERSVNALYIAFGRLAFATGVAIFCFIVLNSQGGFIGEFLSSQPLAVGSRLAYSFYLVSVPVLDWYTLQLQTRVHWNLPTLVFLYCGALLSSAFVALLLYLFVELPFCQMCGTCAVDDPDEVKRDGKLLGGEALSFSFSEGLEDQIYGSHGIKETLDEDCESAEQHPHNNASQRENLHQGDRVYVRSRGGTRFFRAVVENVNDDDGSYDVVYEDGETPSVQFSSHDRTDQTCLYLGVRAAGTRHRQGVRQSVNEHCFTLTGWDPSQAAADRPTSDATLTTVVSVYFELDLP